MPQTVGRYRIVEKIGQGGMGVVYKALDPLLQRTVAVKLISDEVTLDADSRERFLREARAAAQLAHANVVVIYDLGEDEGRLFLAMEYLTGASLRTYLDRQRPALGRALEIVIDACRGLEFAHRHDIVHRDIKPANLFVTDTNEVKILDFGLARLASSSLTRSQSLMGTINYMSPEQVRGMPVDQRADLFAMGAVLYEMLVGRRAFEGESFAATMFKILEREPEDVTIPNPAVPSSLSAILKRALAKNVEERYRNAGEMLRDLVACRQSLGTVSSDGEDTIPTVVGAAQGPSPAAKTEARSVAWSPRRIRTTAIVGVILTLSFFFSYLPRQPQPEAPAQPDTPPREPSTAQAPGAPVEVAAPAPGSPVPVPQNRTPGPTAARSPVPPARGARGGDGAAETQAAGRSAFAEAAAGLARTRASAEAAGAPALAGAAYRAALALELEAEELSNSGRLSDALARVVEADARFRAAAIEARAETAARERLRSAEPPAPTPGRPPAAEARDEPTVPVESPRPESRPAVRAPEPTAPVANPDTALREVLAQYISALEGRSLTALKRIWPSLSGNQERAIRSEFANARAVQARFLDPRVVVSGETATIAGTREYTLSTQDGQRLSTITRTTITMRHVGEAWVIERIEHQQR